jgi:hypothetical protein
LQNIHDELLPLLLKAIEEQTHLLRAGISEYELLQVLKAAPYQLIKVDSLSDSLVLFQTHFVLFHALYQLRDKWRQHHIGELDIFTTCVKLLPYQHTEKEHLSSNSCKNEPAVKDPIAEYYLDWSNINNTTAGDVEALLDGFWHKMLGAHSLETNPEIDQQQLDVAIRTLDITSIETLDLKTLKRHYHKQQHLHHPDKGGSVEQAQKLIRAFTLLKHFLDTTSE